MSNPVLSSICLIVRNMEKSVALYEQLLQHPVDVMDEHMSVFEFDNIVLMLAKYDPNQEGLIFGNNVVINLEVDDLASVYEKCQYFNLNIRMKKQQMGDFELFQVQDYDGNVTEWYQEVGK